MSNFLAIATVTAALSDLVRTAIPPDLSNAVVTTVRPGGEAASTDPRVNVFLYQVTPNPNWQNVDLPTRRAAGDLMQRPQAALDLHYLLTFSGADAQLEPQRILGSVVRTLHARPILTRALIRQSIAQPLFGFLAGSNLADAPELVKLTPLPLTLEELSKLWSIYFQTPYSLSVAYQASVVLIESDDSPRESLPVRERNLYVVPFRQSIVEAVRSAAGEGVPIGPQSAIVIAGRKLRGEVTQVRIGGLPPITTFTESSDTEIRLTLPAALTPGVHGLQVVHPAMMGTPPAEHRGTESNLAPFVLHPVIRRNTDGTPAITFANAATTAGTRAADVRVLVDPPVGKTQRAQLLMNEANAPAGRAPRAYTFDAAPRNAAADPPTANSLMFRMRGVLPGAYLVRVQVDGADSPLEVAAPPAEPAYIGPKVTIA